MPWGTYQLDMPVRDYASLFRDKIHVIKFLQSSKAYLVTNHHSNGTKKKQTGRTQAESNQHAASITTTIT